MYSVNADDWKHGPNLMVTQSSHAINANAQEVLFYLYALDLKTVRDVQGLSWVLPRPRSPVTLVGSRQRPARWRSGPLIRGLPPGAMLSARYV